MNRKNRVWVEEPPKPVKLSQWDKESLLKRVEAEVAKTTKLQKDVSRIEIRAGRVYFYKLYEQFIIEGTTVTIPLIEGKYVEFPYARITVYDKTFRDCSLNWQRYNNQWMTVNEGTLEECIQKAEQSDWFR